jgi:hypothetical protein
MEDSSILELNIKGLYTKIGDSEVSWGVKVTKVVDLGTICVCVCVCVCVWLTKSTWLPYPKPYLNANCLP